MEQATSTGTGYRVRDVVVDPLLQRTFVRVESCASPRNTPVLLPFASIQLPAHTPAAAASKQSVPAVAPGSAVDVSMRSERTDLLLRGKTQSSADVGDLVEVEVAPMQAGMPALRFRGRLVTASRVEVER